MSKIEQKPKPEYEAPRLIELGTLHDLTLCEKQWGGSDGHTFQQQPIFCGSG